MEGAKVEEKGAERVGGVVDVETDGDIVGVARRLRVMWGLELFGFGFLFMGVLGGVWWLSIAPGYGFAALGVFPAAFRGGRVCPSNEKTCDPVFGSGIGFGDGAVAMGLLHVVLVVVGVFGWWFVGWWWKEELDEVWNVVEKERDVKGEGWWRAAGVLAVMLVVSAGFVVVALFIDPIEPFHTERLFFCAVVFIFNATESMLAKKLVFSYVVPLDSALGVWLLFVLQVCLPILSTTLSLSLPSLVRLPMHDPTLPPPASLVPFYQRSTATAAEIVTFAYGSTIAAQALRFSSILLLALLPPHLRHIVPQEHKNYGVLAPTVLQLQLLGFVAFLGTLNPLLFPVALAILTLLHFSAKLRNHLKSQVLSPTSTSTSTSTSHPPPSHPPPSHTPPASNPRVAPIPDEEQSKAPPPRTPILTTTPHPSKPISLTTIKGKELGAAALPIAHALLLLFPLLSILGTGIFLAPLSPTLFYTTLATIPLLLVPPILKCAKLA